MIHSITMLCVFCPRAAWKDHRTFILSHLTSATEKLNRQYPHEPTMRLQIQIHAPLSDPAVHSASCGQSSSLSGSGYKEIFKIMEPGYLIDALYGDAHSDRGTAGRRSSANRRTREQIVGALDLRGYFFFARGSTAAVSFLRGGGRWCSGRQRSGYWRDCSRFSLLQR